MTITGDMAAAIVNADKAQLIELIAEDLIANNRTIINAAMRNLSIEERADFATAFAQEFWAELGVFERLQASEAWIGNTMIDEDVIHTRNIRFTEDLMGNVAQLLHLVVDHIDVNSLWADQSWQTAGHFGSEDADQQTRVDGTGVTLYRTIDGEQVPAAQFGGGLTRLAFFEGNESVGSISQEGDGSFQQLSANHLTVAG